jgi:molybdenum cofactor cytidylyltransferase
MSVAAIVLAAGKASRFAQGNKLTACIAGTPIVRHVVNAALGSRAAPIVVVTGYWESAVRATLADLPLLWQHNPAPDRGLSSSIQVGIGSLGSDVTAAIVCLGDMPYVRASHLVALAEAFVASSGNAICVPTFQGRRGNPVLWPAHWFDSLTRLRGDQGARSLIAAHLEHVRWVPVSDPGVLVDIDSSEDLTRRNHLGVE